jgi:Domain of unknown function (DUF1707)
MSASGSTAVVMASADGGSGQPRRLRRGLPLGGKVANPQDMRVSHADRAAVTDELSRHYSEGRLDDDEFSLRLDRALKAKTYHDLAGLLQDVPPADALAADPSLATGMRAAHGSQAGSYHAPGGTGARRARGLPRPRRRRRGPRLLLAVTVIILAAIALTDVSRAVDGTMTVVLWLTLLGAIAMVVARHRPRRW